MSEDLEVAEAVVYFRWIAKSIYAQFKAIC